MTDPYWTAIPGASGYEISSDGTRVRSLDRYVKTRVGPRLWKGKELRTYPAVDRGGYLLVNVRFDDDPKRKAHLVHRLVCLTFHGPPPHSDSLVRHLNDVKTDNRPENLAWGDKSDNAYDSVRLGNHPMANKTHCPQGHEWDGSRWPRGVRYCRVCRDEHQQRRRDERANWRNLENVERERDEANAKIAAIQELANSWRVPDDMYLRLDGPDLGYADAAVQIDAIINRALP